MVRIVEGGGDKPVAACQGRMKKLNIYVSGKMAPNLIIEMKGTLRVLVRRGKDLLSHCMKYLCPRNLVVGLPLKT